MIIYFVKPSIKLFNLISFIFFTSIKSFVMVNKCSVFGCQTGYNKDDNVGISLHKYPLNDKELCEKWIRANPRENFVPTMYSRVCAIHFKPTDFIYESTDSNPRRKKAKIDNGKEMKIKHLKPGVVPSIFPNAPKYLTTPSTERPTKFATSEQRHQSENCRIKLLYDEFKSQENVQNDTLQQILDKLSMQSLPHGFLMNIVDNILLIFKVNVENVPIIDASLKIYEDKSVKMFVNGKLVSCSQKIILYCFRK